MNVITLAKIHLVLIFAIPILLIIGLLYVIRKKNKKLILYYLLTLCLFYYTIYVKKYDFSYTDKKLPYKLLLEGTYIRLYEHPTDKNKVIKSMKPVYAIPKVGDGDELEDDGNKSYGKCGKGWIIKDVGKCEGTKCNYLQYVYWIIIFGVMSLQNKVRLKIQEETNVITKISNITKDNYTWEEEKIFNVDKMHLNIVDEEEKLKTQINEFNKILEKNKLFCLDAHVENFGFDKDNNIKNFDGEIVPQWAKEIYIFLYHYLRRYEMSSYHFFNRIFFTNEPANKRGAKRYPISKWERKFKNI